MLVNNPVIPGFNPDPSLCRKGDDYYIAVSSFEWFPGVPIYHSRDMRHWELYANALTNESQLGLSGLPSAKGVWAPSLTWSERNRSFNLVYGIMRSMGGRYFDVDNYLVSAPDPRVPWSEPTYLHSAGFDASLFEDDDGRMWVVSLDWETRPGYEKPGQICLVEYDPAARAVIGYPRRIWGGATKRGCLEAPHLTKRGGWYYLMCAEGGTGYYHCVTMARSRTVAGPYEPDPAGPILTSNDVDHDERADVDHLKPRYFNPSAPLQKCGHGSYVESAAGEVFLAHLCARPFEPELRCTLGRETALQRMKWTDDGWLRLMGGGCIARESYDGGSLPDWEPHHMPCHDEFDGETLGLGYYAPRIDHASFVDLTARPGWLRLRGQEAPTSTNRVSLVGRKLASLRCEAQTLMDFKPEVHQHSAGIILYYDNMNWMCLRKYWSDGLGGPALSVIHMRNGVRVDPPGSRVAIGEGSVGLRVSIEGRATSFSWRLGDGAWMPIGPALDTSELSDEFSDFGEFTGTFVGLFCCDRLLKSHCADFDWFEVMDA